jgi:TonB family protein
VTPEAAAFVEQPPRPRWLPALVLAGGLATIRALAQGPDALGGPPPFKLEAAHAYYPAEAKQQGLAGRVGLTCTIDAQGRARDIAVVESAGKLLDEAARQLLADERFEVPADWSRSGGPARTYAFGVIFEFSDKPKPAAFEDDRPTIVVEARAVPRV